MRRSAVLAACFLSAFVCAGHASAGYGLQPSGQTFAVQADSSGTITSPGSIDYLIYFDSLDSSPRVFVSDSPAMTASGQPTGTVVASCAPTAFRPWTAPGKLVCSAPTTSMRAGRTYYWWLTFSRNDGGPPGRVSGPFSFALAPASPAPAPDAGFTLSTSSPRVGEQVRATATGSAADYRWDWGDGMMGTGPSSLHGYLKAGTYTISLTVTAAVGGSATSSRKITVGAAGSTATYTKASFLPSSSSYTGRRSIKHAKLTKLIYRTMRFLPRPRVLAVACWNAADFESVKMDIDGGPTSHGGITTLGFWYYKQPRWLHLGPWACGRIQTLLDTKSASGATGNALVVALHETMHAYGIVNEAQANCFAVQLVPIAAAEAGLPEKRALYLGDLAVKYTRSHAPGGYWDSAQCRDGGRWDFFPRRANLK